MDVSTPGTKRPVTLLLAAGIVALQGLAALVFGVLEVAQTSRHNLGMAVTTAAFFVLLGVGLLWAARSLAQVSSWARGPVVAVELIELLLSYSFLGGQTTPVAVVLAVVAVAGLVCVLHPSSTRALATDPG